MLGDQTFRRVPCLEMTWENRACAGMDLDFLKLNPACLFQILAIKGAMVGWADQRNLPQFTWTWCLSSQDLYWQDRIPENLPPFLPVCRVEGCCVCQGSMSLRGSSFPPHARQTALASVAETAFMRLSPGLSPLSGRCILFLQRFYVASYFILFFCFSFSSKVLLIPKIFKNL